MYDLRRKKKNFVCLMPVFRFARYLRVENVIILDDGFSHVRSSCADSNSLLLQIICYKHHISDTHLCGYEFSWCVGLNSLSGKMTCHKNHICNLCGLHAMCGCVSLNVLLEKMIYHKIHIYNFCDLHEYVSSIYIYGPGHLKVN